MLLNIKRDRTNTNISECKILWELFSEAIAKTIVYMKKKFLRKSYNWYENIKEKRSVYIYFGILSIVCLIFVVSRIYYWIQNPIPSIAFTHELGRFIYSIRGDRLENSFCYWLFYLHKQPPLMLIYLGLLIKIFSFKITIIPYILAYGANICFLGTFLLYFYLAYKVNARKGILSLLILGLLFINVMLLNDFYSLGKTLFVPQDALDSGASYDVYYTLFLALLIVCFYKFVYCQSIRNVVLLGFLSALLALTRPIAVIMFLVVLFFIVLIMLLQKERLKKIAFLSVYFLIPVLLLQGSWMLKNYCLFKLVSLSSWQGSGRMRLFRAMEGELKQIALTDDWQASDWFQICMKNNAQSAIVDWHFDNLGEYNLIVESFQKTGRDPQELEFVRKDISMQEQHGDNIYWDGGYYYNSYSKMAFSKERNKLANYMLFNYPRKYGLCFLSSYLNYTWRIPVNVFEYFKNNNLKFERLSSSGQDLNFRIFEFMVIVLSFIIIHIFYPLMFIIRIILKKVDKTFWIILFTYCIVMQNLLITSFAESGENHRFFMYTYPAICLLLVLLPRFCSLGSKKNV